MTKPKKNIWFIAVMLAAGIILITTGLVVYGNASIHMDGVLSWISQGVLTNIFTWLPLILGAVLIIIAVGFAFILYRRYLEGRA